MKLCRLCAAAALFAKREQVVATLELLEARMTALLT